MLTGSLRSVKIVVKSCVVMNEMAVAISSEAVQSLTMKVAEVSSFPWSSKVVNAKAGLTRYLGASR